MASFAQKAGDFFSHFFQRYKPAIITLLVLAGGYYFYVNVIVSDNEDALQERNFRGLNRMAANIAGKMDDYAKQNAAHFLAIVKDTSSLWRTRPRLITQDYGLEVWRRSGTEPLKAQGVNEKEGWKIFFRDKADTAIMAYAPAEEFVTPFLRRDLFPRYFFACGDTVLFDELNISNRFRTDFLKAKKGPDTTKTGAVQAGEVQDLNIAGQDYKLFFLSFSGEGKRPYTLGGYMPMSQYESEKRYIPTYALIWMVIGLLLVLLMFPLLKIFLMQRSEQLLARNAIASMAALHVLGAVAVLIALNVFVYFTFVTPGIDRDLRNLAQATKTQFLAELDAAVAEMEAVEAGMPPTSFDSADKELEPPPLGDSQSATHRPGRIYPYFRHLAWANDTGMQILRWTMQAPPPKKIDVSNRDYFSAVKNGGLRKRNGDPFYLTAVSSWVSREKLIVVSKRSRFADSASPGGRRPLVMNLSGPFRSLFNAVLPDGYGFCLVRPNGDVLFHSDQNRSLNENIVTECSSGDAVEALLQTRSEDHLGTRYSGSTQRMFVTPVEGLPFSVATFRDMRLTWSEDLDVISACSILCLMNLAVILLAILIIQASGYRHSLLQNQSILFTWLRPNQRLRRAYQSVAVFFVASVVLQALWLFFYSDEDRLCLVGISFSYSYILLGYMFYHFAVAGHKADVGEAAANSRIHFSENEKLRNRRALFSLVLVYLFATAIFCFTLHSGQGVFLLSQAALIGTGALFSFTGVLKSLLRLQFGFRWWYVSSLFSFVAATAITPILVFYWLSYKEERLLSLKHNQLLFADKLAQQGYGSLSATAAQAYAAPYHYKSFADSVVAAPAPQNKTADATDGFEHLYSVIKPAFSTHSRQIEYFIRNSHLNGADFNWLHQDSIVQLHYRLQQVKPAADGAGLRVLSHLRLGEEALTTVRKMWKNSLSLVAALLLLIGGFLFLLKRLVQRIFFEGYDDTPDLSDTDLPYLNHLILDENIFVIGPINSGKRTKAKLLLKDMPDLQLVEADFAQLTDRSAQDLLNDVDQAVEKIVGKVEAGTEPAKMPVVMLRHFEVGLNDFTVNEKKLTVLENLLRVKRRLVILSARSVANMPMKDAEGKKDYTERWSNAMNQFYNLYHHWQVRDNKNQQANLEEVKASLEKSGWQKMEPGVNKREQGKRKAELEAELKKAGREDFTKALDKRLAAVGKWVDARRQTTAPKAYTKGLYGRMTATRVRRMTAEMTRLGRAEFIRELDKRMAADRSEIEKDLKGFYNERVNEYLSAVMKECSHSDFLWNLLPTVFIHIQKQETINLRIDFDQQSTGHIKRIIRRHFTTQFEQVCLKIESLAANYYLAVWQSLTRDEQRTLLDIGTDDMVNPANRFIASRLANLGLVIPEEDIACYTLMNRSFRNFIFTQLDKAELKTLQDDAAEKGSWSSFELPVLTVVVAFGAFLFTTQKDAFTNLLTYLGAAAGGIAALLKVLGMIPSNKT